MRIQWRRAGRATDIKISLSRGLTSDALGHWTTRVARDDKDDKSHVTVYQRRAGPSTTSHLVFLGQCSVRLAGDEVWARMPPVSKYSLYPTGSRTLTMADRELPLAGVVLCFTSILPEQRVGRDPFL